MRSVSSEIPTREGVLAAATRVAGRIVRTPLLPGRGERRLLLKAEVLQRTGSFKIRGALNFVGALGPEQRSRGVVAYSSGNHAQGIALAARILGTHSESLTNKLSEFQKKQEQSVLENSEL